MDFYALSHPLAVSRRHEKLSDKTAHWKPALAVMLSMLSPDVALAQFKPVRYDDDFARQSETCADDEALACWKNRRISDEIYLSVGGDLRWRYEFVNNPRYGEARQDRWGAVLQRYSAFADVRFGQHWLGFAQLSTSRAQGRAAGPSPVDANRLDATNLFVDWHTPADGATQLGVRAGIQELLFGSGRAIDPREGPNVRLSFDAVRVYATVGGWRIDGFTATPREARPGSFDDRRSPTQSLRGLYTTHEQSGNGWDVYLFHYEDKAARYPQGNGHERRWTLGTRAFGRRGLWDWNWEMAVQGGHFDQATIRAWSIATETGYNFDDRRGSPRLSLSAAVASGDRDRHDDRLGTLNPMYPRGNYFGDEATLGPRNFFNIQPTLLLRPVSTLQISARIDLFWRHSAEDGVYAPNGMLMRGPGDSDARHVATIASLFVQWTPAPRWSTSLVHAQSRAGRFLRDTGAHDHLSHTAVTLQYRF
jgi:hypothetical protein